MTLGNADSLRWFLPEAIVSAAALVILAADLVSGRPRLGRSAALALAGLGAALAVTLAQADGALRGLFGGLMAKDPLGDFFRVFFIATAALVSVAALRARDAVDFTAGAPESAEFYALVLTTVVGMSLMATATDLLTAFVSLETVSIMGYVLAGFRRRSRASSEAALKYVIYGGVAAGVMLYGMSLLYGLAGSTRLDAIREVCAATGPTTTVVLAVVLCLAGFGYKIAAVPFHMWCPDVYQGAPTPVTAFLSVGPKAAGFALLLRFFAGAVPEAGPWALLLVVIACATMTLGNLAALSQVNLKRLLAYSSIAHAGYLLLGLAAGGADGHRAILVYLVTYLFMNLGAFVVVMVVSEAGGGEALADYRGLGRRAPMAAFAMAVFLFSLTGLPPLAGFFGKFYVFYALIARGGALFLTAAVIGVLNSAVSLYYYARVLRVMYFEAGPETAVPVARVHALSLILTAAPTIALCLVWSPLVRYVDASLAMWLR